MKRNCPICGSAAKLELWAEECPYFRCPRCKFLFHRSEENTGSRQYDAEYWNSERAEAIRRETQDSVCRALELIFLSRIPVVRLLDFGCGKGLTVDTLRRLLPCLDDLCGVDPFGEFVPNEYLHLKSLRDLQNHYPPEHFDAVFSIEVFEHLLDPKKALEEIDYFLKPGGTVLVNTGTWEFLQRYDPALVYLRPRSLGHVSIYSLATFRYLAKKFGYEASFMAARPYAILLTKPGSRRAPPLPENLATLAHIGEWFTLLFREYIRLVNLELEFEERARASLPGALRSWLNTGRFSESKPPHEGLEDTPKSELPTTDIAPEPTVFSSTPSKGAGIVCAEGRVKMVTTKKADLQTRRLLPSKEEVKTFLAQLLRGRDDVPHYRFLREYWLEIGHIDRLLYLFDRIAPLLKPDDALLDAGSSGEWPLLLWKFVGLNRLYACDMNGGYLTYGQGSLKTSEESGKEFELVIQKMDLETEPLPFEDRSLDVVTCFETLEHFRYDPVFVLKEFNRVLKREGLFILTTPNINSYHGLLRILELKTPCIFSRYHPDRGGIGHCKEYSCRELEELLGNCGFTAETLETFDCLPPLDLEAETLSKWEDLRNFLKAKKWREELAGQSIFAIGRCVSEPRYRYYFPLYTLTEVSQESCWFPEAINGATVEERRPQRLVLRTGAQPHSQAKARYVSDTGPGDFSLVVAYTLVLFPKPATDRVEVAALLSSPELQESYSIGRQLIASGHSCYVLEEENGARQDVPTTHSTGQLRLRRAGTTLQGEYWDWESRSWQSIGQCPVSPTSLVIWLHAYNGASDAEIEVHLGDFALTTSGHSPQVGESGVADAASTPVGEGMRQAGVENPAIPPLSAIDEQTYASKVEKESAFYNTLHSQSESLTEPANAALACALDKLQEKVRKQLGLTVWDFVAKAVNERPGCRLLSLGSGPSGTEINLAKNFTVPYRFHCMDINPELLAKGEARCHELGLPFQFTPQDINKLSLLPHSYDIVFSHAALHHFVALEHIFSQVKQALKSDGLFILYEAIPRNGMLMWPETNEVVQEIWRTLPDRLKYDHSYGEPVFSPDRPDRDLSADGFECIRSQDIYPLLKKMFHVEIEIPGFTLMRRFVDSDFGPNYDMSNPEDAALVERLWELDEQYLTSGKLKPDAIFMVLRSEAPKPARR